MSKTKLPMVINLEFRSVRDAVAGMTALSKRFTANSLSVRLVGSMEFEPEEGEPDAR